MQTTISNNFKVDFIGAIKLSERFYHYLMQASENSN